MDDGLSLIDAIEVHDSPSLLVWRTPHTCAHRAHFLDALKEFADENLPQVVGVVVIPMGDGLDVLDEREMAMLGWQRIPQAG